jgi:hypothetical protein
MGWGKKKPKPEKKPHKPKRPPEGLGTCKYCGTKNGHTGQCPTIS